MALDNLLTIPFNSSIDNQSNSNYPTSQTEVVSIPTEDLDERNELELVETEQQQQQRSDQKARPFDTQTDSIKTARNQSIIEVETEKPKPQPLGTLQTLEQTRAIELVDKLFETINSFYYDVDQEAIETILSFIAAYRFNEMNPLWMHIIGDSGSGKTALSGAILEDTFPDHHQAGQLSASTLLSAHTKGKEGGKYNSLLHRIGGRGILYFPDFTNFLANEDRVVKQVAGTLREVYDGKTAKDAGIGGKQVSWAGKISILTCFTPARERAWMRYNAEGERFVALRWKAPRRPMSSEDRNDLARSFDNAQSEEDVRDKIKAIVVELMGALREYNDEGECLNSDTDSWLMPLAQTGIEGMGLEREAEMLARLATKLRSMPNHNWQQQVTFVAGEESPFRLRHQIIKAARGRASYHRREQYNRDDWKLAVRLAIDSIPQQRRWILESLPMNGSAIGISSLRKLSKLTARELGTGGGFYTNEAMQGYLDELASLEVIKPSRSTLDGDPGYRLMDGFLEMLSQGAKEWMRSIEEKWEEKWDRVTEVDIED